MKRNIVFSFLFLGLITIYGQDKQAIKFAKTIKEKDLESYLSVLSADSLEGRETGEPGQKKAAQFIAAKFESFGLQPVVETPSGFSFFQTYPLNKRNYVTAYMKKGSEQKQNFEDFLMYSNSETIGEEYADILFLGVKTIDQLKNMDLSGKFVAFNSPELHDWKRVTQGVKELDAEGVMVIINNQQYFRYLIGFYKKRLSKSKLALESANEPKIIFGDPALAEWIFDLGYDSLRASGVGNKARVIINSDQLVEEIIAENVLGYIEGTEKPEEVLVITSHYDHLGIDEKGEIYNGADDDGSGTSTVLEIAQAFAIAAEKGYRPERSILFMTVSGEEKGLLGSEYYANHPVFPIENTVTNLNADMVGRIDPIHEIEPDYIYLIGSDKLSSELHEISEKVNKTYTKLALDYTYNAEDDPNRYYYRSDHYNFAEKGVPVIFYFNGSHDDYHRPTDTIDKIEFGLMKKRAQLIFYTAWELANRENRVKVDEK